ncbi:hypothetical protein QTP88_027831 [Uroleucon formosanum]
MDKQKAFLSINEMFNYLQCTPGARCVSKGEEVLNAGHIILCGIKIIIESKIYLYALCLQTSALISHPHEINGSIEMEKLKNDINYKIKLVEFLCSCKAGASGCCKHISAYLIQCTRENILEFEKISSTDIKCVWSAGKKTSVQNYKPRPLIDTNCIKAHDLNMLSTVSEIDILKTLIRTNPNIGGLNIANDNDDVKLEKYIANCILNKSVQSAVLLQLCFYTENVNEIKSCCRNTYNSLFVCDIEEVYFKSKINRSNWNEERKYRITGSTDWKKKATNYFNSKKISNDYTCHGEYEEGNARNAYVLKIGAIVEETGIIVSNSNPWLSYPPDGVIMDNHVPKKLLEIKCPYLNSDGNPKTLQINESFIGFVEILDQSGVGLEESIINCITKNNLNLPKLRGQGYDGAANISGVYSGVQARLKSKHKLATYIHCAFYNLNLVLNDAMNSSTEVKNFFGLVEKIYTFFSNSIKRWQLLLSSESSDISITLKRLCTTRWSSRYDSLLAIRHRYVDILKCLSQIVLRSKNEDEIFEANYLKVHMEDFQFIFSVIFIGKFLETVNVVSKVLQSPKQKLSTAVSLLNSALINLQEYRSQYSDFFEIAVEIGKKWGVLQKFKEKRSRRVKRFYDEILQDYCFTSAEEYFKINIFYLTLDNAIMQLKERFTSLNNVFKIFEVIQPNSLINLTDEHIYISANKLVEYYDSDLSNALAGQILSFRSCFKGEITKRTSVKAITELLVIENPILATTFSEICTACMLFLTLPVTVATAERSFPKLKLIKNYLRSTMCEERLSGLGILSIENDRARQLNLKEIINNFAEKKARKRNFH